MADSFQLKAILSAVDKLSPVLKGVQGVAKATRKHLSDIGSAAGSVAGKIGLPLATLATLTGGGLILAAKKAVTDFTDAGAGLDDMSKRTGETATNLQRLAYIGEMADVSMEALQGSTGKLNKNIGEALAGKNKDLASLFHRLHISLKDGNGQTRTAVDLLPQLADVFQRNTNQVTRARLGNALFGKSWQEIVPLLLDGSKGIAEASKRFDSIGFKLSEEDIKRAAELDDKFVDLRYASDGLFKSIGAKLAPVVIPFVDRLITWVAANRDLLSTEVDGMVSRLAAALKEVDFDQMLKDLKSIIQSVRAFLDQIGGVRTVLIALGVLLAAGPILSVLQLAAAVGKLGWFFGSFLVQSLGAVLPLLSSAASVIGGALFLALQLVTGAVMALGKVMLANPVVLIVTGIGLAAYMLIKHWDKVKIWFTSFFDWVGKKWEEFGGWITKTVDAVGGLFTGGPATPKAGLGSAPGRTNSFVGAGGQQKVGGTVVVDFRNAPQGMRVVDSKSTPGFNVAPAVGYRGFAMDNK